MGEKLTFETSGLVKNKADKNEIEFWGHDAGEFTLEWVEELLALAEDQKSQESED